ncbi:hypothetical protein NEUTE2DRAFT_118817 [Neurospora tetrasperma FGSC 2509]|nr:hypothetical protein NEUTE2DRAFT_118817 [Neurospora tetrasperma FGSC 2509]
MSSIHIDRFLAAGCVVINEAESGISPALWAVPLLHTWHRIDVPASKGKPKYNPSIGPIHIAGSDPPLYPSVQDALLESPFLSPFQSLLGSKWVHTTFRVTAEFPSRGIVRVYILPDDVENRLLPRSNTHLRQLRTRLFQLLDCSSCTWNGNVKCQKVDNDGNNTDQDLIGKPQTLLQMFNTLPAPNPKPNQVQDLDRRASMHNLLDNKVLGLKTTLYPFQCRSAASMVQRESQTEPVPDPRLPKRYVDHLGKTYYVDPIAKTIVIDPAYYDSVCGGILAEEMGAGKTLICLALILATKHIPTSVPELYRGADPIVRHKVGSLMDMAAAVVTRSGAPWKDIFAPDNQENDGFQYDSVINAIQRNPGWYRLPRPVSPRLTRRNTTETRGEMIYLSHTSLIIVPPNLVTHWEQEIEKHTSSLRVLLQTKTLCLPAAEELKEYDIVLFSRSIFESIHSSKQATKTSSRSRQSNPLANVHLKRCIVDEGHILGNSSGGVKSMPKTNLQHVINGLHVDAKWVVTGTPSKGLYGLEHGVRGSLEQNHQVSTDLELQDLKAIGVMASVFLKARPWANTLGDTRSLGVVGATKDHVLWEDYVVKPWSSRTMDRRDDCLKATLGSLIVRHPKLEIVPFLPSVEERTVYLDGSYQDILSINLFSMYIIFNAVQSVRTDEDYFFHKTQRDALANLVKNLRQASFFGGQFFPRSDIFQAIDRAERFLDEGAVNITAKDDDLLRTAIEFGRVAVSNTIKDSAHCFAHIPVFVENFPFGAGEHWSLDVSGRDPVCTIAPLLLRLQERLKPFIKSPKTLDTLPALGDIATWGEHDRRNALAHTSWEKFGPLQDNVSTVGTTDTHSNMRKKALRVTKPFVGKTKLAQEQQSSIAGAASEVAAPLLRTRLISTASAKLSYLVDQIIQHQEAEQILVFYENDNVAYYLAEVLEVLEIQHLIYAKGITSERKNHYLATFTLKPKIRVMLMDVSQAAYGLDMKTASRIYFINPVLNPQVGAQAIGRARRISQQKPVTVETLVLHGSIDEVIVRRRKEMSPAEQRKCSRGSILDDRPIYNWILNAKILPLPASVDKDDGPAQMAKLAEPQYIFGRSSGTYREHPDTDLVMRDLGSDALRAVNAGRKTQRDNEVTTSGQYITATLGSNKRTYQDDDGAIHLATSSMEKYGDVMMMDAQQRAEPDLAEGPPSSRSTKRLRVRFADTDEN